MILCRGIASYNGYCQGILRTGGRRLLIDDDHCPFSCPHTTEMNQDKDLIDGNSDIDACIRPDCKEAF